MPGGNRYAVVMQALMKICQGTADAAFSTCSRTQFIAPRLSATKAGRRVNRRAAFHFLAEGGLDTQISRAGVLPLGWGIRRRPLARPWNMPCARTAQRYVSRKKVQSRFSIWKRWHLHKQDQTRWCQITCGWRALIAGFSGLVGLISAPPRAG